MEKDIKQDTLENIDIEKNIDDTSAETPSDEKENEANQSPKESDQRPHTNPNLVVLQWVTYAFWGWTVFATSLLVINILSFFLTDTGDESFAPYGIAAVLVLLPISIICDIFYSKQEPDKKEGAASIVMIIHSVIFALIAIGSFVSIAFSVVQLLVSGTDSSSLLVGIYSGIIVSMLFGLVFVRTLLPNIMHGFRKLFLITMSLVIGASLVLGVIGPLNSLIVTRDDRLIDNSLPTIVQSIESYASINDKLPDDLSKLSLDSNAKQLIDKGMVTYSANTKQPVVTDKDGTLSSYTTYYYQLCVTYKKQIDRIGVTNYTIPEADTDGYTSYISTDVHPAGDYCYKVSTYPTYIKNATD